MPTLIREYVVSIPESVKRRTKRKTSKGQCVVEGCTRPAGRGCSGACSACAQRTWAMIREGTISREEAEEKGLFLEKERPGPRVTNPASIAVHQSTTVS